MQTAGPCPRREWVLKSSLLVAMAVYTYLRLIVDHHGTAQLQALRQKEVGFCTALLRERVSEHGGGLAPGRGTPGSVWGRGWLRAACASPALRRTRRGGGSRRGTAMLPGGAARPSGPGAFPVSFADTCNAADAGCPWAPTMVERDCDVSTLRSRARRPQVCAL